MVAVLLKPLLRRSGFFVFLLTLINVGACTWLHAAAEPDVTLTSVSFGGSNGPMQVIHLGVMVRNPNAFALSVNRLDYRVFLEGGEVASGRRVDPLTIAANDSASFSVPVTVNLLSGLPLLDKLMRSPKNTLAYRLEVDADVVNFGLGMMTMTKESTIRLTPQ